MNHLFHHCSFWKPIARPNFAKIKFPVLLVYLCKNVGVERAESMLEAEQPQQAGDHCTVLTDINDAWPVAGSA